MPSSVELWLTNAMRAFVPPTSAARVVGALWDAILDMYAARSCFITGQIQYYKAYMKKLCISATVGAELNRPTQDTVNMQTNMSREAEGTAIAVARQIDAVRSAFEDLGHRLRRQPPSVVVTCARGSSDHAATYAKYLIESQLGIVASSAAPSISSQYQVPMRLDNALYLVISQSGASPDLVSAASAARENGAFVVALVNTVPSPLADLADFVLPLHAGIEKSVAATKSFIASLTALLQLVAFWKNDQPLIDSIADLPEVLHETWALDWSPISDLFRNAEHMFVIGRGLGFGVAQEAALKLKETCNLHAEAYSAAEVKHGPMAIVGDQFPVLLFSQNDQTAKSVNDVAAEFRARGAHVLAAGPGPQAEWRLPSLAVSHAAVCPILLIQSFYKAVDALAATRGLNPDAPPTLNKVTRTL